jgi:hypothetical protein
MVRPRELHWAAQLRSVTLVTTAAPANVDATIVDVFRDVPMMAHARDGAGPVRSLVVSGALHASGSLTLEFQLAAELRAVRLAPSVCQPQRRHELWRHTCFELFARRGNEPGYCEFNFSACGDWAAYEFDDYRGSRRDAAQRPIEVSVQTLDLAQIQLRARIDLQSAFAIEAAALEFADWRLNCAAVIESSDGSLSYWAVHHPRAQPDFHDPAGFCVALSGARSRAGAQQARQ